MAPRSTRGSLPEMSRTYCTEPTRPISRPIWSCVATLAAAALPAVPARASRCTIFFSMRSGICSSALFASGAGSCSARPCRLLATENSEAPSRIEKLAV